MTSVTAEVFGKPDAQEDVPITKDEEGGKEDSAIVSSQEEGTHWPGGVVALPPMQKRSPRRCVEASRGCMLVLGLIVLYVSFTVAAILTAPTIPTVEALVFLGIIGAEAVIALTCFANIMLADPGTLHRSTASCFPMPPGVVQALRDGEKLDFNIVSRGTTFCVRCLVWRPKESNVHHCGICQRCVRDFDHHCDVLGRCISGYYPKDASRRRKILKLSWSIFFRGNMPYFLTLIAMSFAGFFSCVVSICVAISYGSNAAIFLLAALVAIFVLAVAAAFFVCWTFTRGFPGLGVWDSY
eukprot:TRINITY_DN73538_c0_g1_i1.p1 TRINITY_DN73538_c0_g1~~TRINITY_DN73538_c0_g1_i1.p1  ORF type:complete len:297 (-),score=5.12 TRINITY_DN73538_c0_g1_i1:238-1128(-)